MAIAWSLTIHRRAELVAERGMGDGVQDVVRVDEMRLFSRHE